MICSKRSRGSILRGAEVKSPCSFFSEMVNRIGLRSNRVDTTQKASLIRNLIDHLKIQVICDRFSERLC